MREILDMEDWIDTDIRLKLLPEYFKKTLERLYPGGVNHDNAKQATELIHPILEVLSRCGVPASGYDLKHASVKMQEAEILFSELLKPEERLALLTEDQKKQLEKAAEEIGYHPDDSLFDNLILIAIEIARMMDDWDIPHHQFPPKPPETDWMDQEMVTRRPYYTEPFCQVRKIEARRLNLPERIACMFDHEKVALEDVLETYKKFHDGKDEYKKFHARQALEKAMTDIGIPVNNQQLNNRNKYKNKLLSAINYGKIW